MPSLPEPFLPEIEASNDPCRTNLGFIWQELVAGTTRVAAWAYTIDRCYMKLVPRDPAETRLIDRPKDAGMLKRVLLGEAQKVVAIDSPCSNSTVATACGRCLRDFGLDPRPTHAPLLLTMAVHAVEEPSHAWEGRLTHVARESGSYRIVSAERPDRALVTILPAIEYEVARLRVEGRAHAQIAALRDRKPRTVANQIAAIYAKFGVSSRLDFMLALTRRRRAWSDRLLRRTSHNDVGDFTRQSTEWAR